MGKANVPDCFYRTQHPKWKAFFCLFACFKVFFQDVAKACMNCIDSQVTRENIFWGSALLGDFPRGRGASWASCELEQGKGKGSATKDELHSDALTL